MKKLQTVRKSLEQLNRSRLAPFFAVTGNASDISMTATRWFTGFSYSVSGVSRKHSCNKQRPVSFDRDAMDQLFSLPAFSTWRASGGVVVSDDLGSLAVRRFL
jgi:beta-N-acetylhexosaminidase